MPKLIVRAVIAAFAVAVVAPACTSDNDDAATMADEATDLTAAGEAGDGGAGATGSGAGAGGPVDLTGATPLGAVRSLIRTAEVSLTVEDVAAAASAAVAAAESAGGFQSAGSLELDEPRTGFVELRVPAERFREVLDAVAELGEVADQHLDTQDVTDQVVDLEARIAAARISVERVRAFLDETANVVDLAAVERELTTRESDLESLLGQQRVVAEQVELSTITVRFGEDEPPALASDPEPSEDIPGFGRALRYGWVALLNGLKVIAAAAGFVAPFAVIGVPILLGVRLLRRRHVPAT